MCSALCVSDVADRSFLTVGVVDADARYRGLGIDVGGCMGLLVVERFYASVLFCCMQTFLEVIIKFLCEDPFCHYVGLGIPLLHALGIAHGVAGVAPWRWCANGRLTAEGLEGLEAIE